MFRTLYARREATNDTALPVEAANTKRDVVLYADREATKFVCRFPWHYRSKPTAGSTTVMHNCSKYRLEWLPTAQQ
jgi:hypothetical protein